MTSYLGRGGGEDSVEADDAGFECAASSATQTIQARCTVGSCSCGPDRGGSVHAGSERIDGGGSWAPIREQELHHGYAENGELVTGFNTSREDLIQRPVLSGRLRPPAA